MAADEIIIIRRADPASADCSELVADLDKLQGELYPPESNYLDSIEELQKSNCQFLGAYLEDELVGCGALKIIDGRYAELKRMYVRSRYRGRGIGQKLLEELEVRSARSGMGLVRLETGIRQPEAVALYRKNGYKEIKAFGNYRDSGLSIFMEKYLDEG